MLRYILFLVNAGTILAGIDTAFEGHVLIGVIVALIGFVGLLLLPESQHSKPRVTRNHFFEAEHQALVREFEFNRHIRRMNEKPLLPIEWEQAMLVKAPPLDPAFLRAIKRG